MTNSEILVKALLKDKPIVTEVLIECAQSPEGEGCWASTGSEDVGDSLIQFSIYVYERLKEFLDQ